jgi:hypothetical protein
MFSYKTKQIILLKCGNNRFSKDTLIKFKTEESEKGFSLSTDIFVYIKSTLLGHGFIIVDS